MGKTGSMRIFSILHTKNLPVPELHIVSGPQIWKTLIGPCGLSQTEICLLLQY